ncbi:MAG: hypothetical protein R3B38_02720 [Patescibacteria group bacterium]
MCRVRVGDKGIKALKGVLTTAAIQLHNGDSANRHLKLSSFSNIEATQFSIKIDGNKAILVGNYDINPKDEYHATQEFDLSSILSRMKRSKDPMSKANSMVTELIKEQLTVDHLGNHQFDFGSSRKKIATS